MIILIKFEYCLNKQQQQQQNKLDNKYLNK